MADEEQEIDLDQITDENLLQSLLDQTDDPEDRKVIRDRIKELKATKKVVREEKVTKLTNTREDMLQAKKKEAEQHKQRTMQMYDNMAKSAPAGDQKKLDTSILKSPAQSRTPTPTAKPFSSSNLPLTLGPKVDHVEDAIKKRQREAEERKRRILAAYDVAAKSTPAGAPKDFDLDMAKNIDLDEYERTKTQNSVSTFEMSGGVSLAKTAVPVVNRQNSQSSEPQMDAMERALRERQEECAARKQALLDRYSQVSKQAAGPKIFV